ncbi:MAG: 2-dehydro-3-deoxygalactonokinase, partial [Alphaproteobacteria bacterium]|nr:2-dehydro-3-deoxygalactonokinase [Alphaproteobacteria bacterium]
MPATTVTDASTPTPTHASERGQPLDRWIAVDWGTTRLRAMLVTEGERESGSHSDDRAPTLLEERSSAQGLASLANQGTQAFDDALATLIEGWQPLPILMCGMVGSRQGWQEIPYQTISEGAPLDLRTLQAVAINSQTAIMPGVCQASPP